jgi:hypothetical protein
VHDLRFVEDNWESPTLGAWGLGWEVWLNGMEITQFTYFQQAGGLECRRSPARSPTASSACACTCRTSTTSSTWCGRSGPQGPVTYRDVYHQNEVEQSAYNFEHANVPDLFARFDACEAEALEAGRARPAAAAYEKVCQASHSFNLLDARRAISVTERQRYILRVRTLSRAVAQAYYAQREKLGFPGLRGAAVRGGEAGMSAPPVKLVGMFDSPYVRRVALSLAQLEVEFEHLPWSVARTRCASASSIRSAACRWWCCRRRGADRVFDHPRLVRRAGRARKRRLLPGGRRAAAAVVQDWLALDPPAPWTRHPRIVSRGVQAGENCTSRGCSAAASRPRGAPRRARSARCAERADAVWLVATAISQADITLASFHPYLRDGGRLRLSALPLVRAPPRIAWSRCPCSRKYYVPLPTRRCRCLPQTATRRCWWRSAPRNCRQVAAGAGRGLLRRRLRRPGETRRRVRARRRAPLQSPRRLAVLFERVALEQPRAAAKCSAPTSTSAWTRTASRRRRCSASPARTAWRRGAGAHHRRPRRALRRAQRKARREHRRAAAGNRRRGAEGAADSQADALGRSRHQPSCARRTGC